MFRILRVFYFWLLLVTALTFWLVGGGQASACRLFGEPSKLSYSFQNQPTGDIAVFLSRLEKDLRNVPERDAQSMSINRKNPMSPAERYIWITPTVKERFADLDPRKIRTSILNEIINDLEKADRLFDPSSNHWDVYAVFNEMGYRFHWLGHILEEVEYDIFTIEKVYQASFYFYESSKLHPHVQKTDHERQYHTMEHLVALQSRHPELRNERYSWKLPYTAESGR